MRRRTLITVLMGFTALATGHGESLTIGLMPAVDSLPLLIAQEEGYFAEEGVSVDLRMFRNQLYRETALQTNEIDGSISDLVNAVYAWRNGTGLRVGSITDGHFALLSSPGSSIRTIEDWERAGSIKVGLLENSIIYYVAERMLEAAGGSPERIELVTTMQVPARMEMLLAGRIEAALLPEPISRVAVARGAHVIVESDILEQTPGVLIFTHEALREKRAEIRALYRAYDRAVAELNDRSDELREAIVRLGEFPSAVEQSMVIPEYGPARRPSDAEFGDVVDWMISKGLITEDPAYDEVMAGPGLY
ncbi:MAG: ABC transporter substrate-binding protein [Spirochaetota bacterium]